MLTIKPVELLRVISLAVVFIAAGNAALAHDTDAETHAKPQTKRREAPAWL